jgi:pimeloyl-ACP methyl ester carboxylesterase
LKLAPVVSPDGKVLTDRAALEVIGDVLGSERLWPLIVDAIAAALAGNYGPLLQAIPPAGSPTFASATGLVLNASIFEAVVATTCADYGTRQPAAQTVAMDGAVGALYPRFFGRFYVAGALALCAHWPQADVPIIRNVERDVDNPILLIGNEFDPLTPLSWTRRLARALGMDRSVVRYRAADTARLPATDYMY